MPFPYNDDDMRYNNEKSQYVLKKDCLLNNVFLDEQIEVMVKTNPRFSQLLEEISDDVYLFIYRYTRQDMKRVKKYLMAKREQYREPLKRAMLYQARYALRSGANMLKDMHGVDIEKTRSLALETMRGNVGMAEQAIQVLFDCGLLYTGKVDVRITDLEDGTY